MEMCEHMYIIEKIHEEAICQTFMSSPTSPVWCITDVRVRAFRSFGQIPVSCRFLSPYIVGVLGPNGAGDHEDRGLGEHVDRHVDLKDIYRV